MMVSQPKRKAREHSATKQAKVSNKASKGGPEDQNRRRKPVLKQKSRIKVALKLICFEETCYS